MKRFYAFVLFALSMLACNASGHWESEDFAAENAALKKESQMRTPVTAASYGGTLPVTSILAPNDGDDVVAQDLRDAEAALLAALKGIGHPVEYTFVQTGTAPGFFVIGPPNLFSGNTWTDSIIKIDVPNCKAGDKIEVHAFGNWQLNSSSSPGDIVGRARIGIVEDVDAANGGPFTYPVAEYGKATIYDDGGSLTLPHNEEYSLHFKYTVIEPGKTRFTVQVRSEDLTGGAGTATIILMFSARMDVTHWKKP
jgi:hypothetical protein